MKTVGMPLGAQWDIRSVSFDPLRCGENFPSFDEGTGVPFECVPQSYETLGSGSWDKITGKRNDDQYLAASVSPSHTKDRFHVIAGHEVLCRDDLPPLVIRGFGGILDEEQTGCAVHLFDDFCILGVDPIQGDPQLLEQTGNHRNGVDERRRGQGDSDMALGLAAVVPIRLFAVGADEREYRRRSLQIGGGADSARFFTKVLFAPGNAPNGTVK